MILCDPFAINTLALSTIRHLQDLVGQDTLPRVSVAAYVLNLNRSLNWINSTHQQKAGTVEVVQLNSQMHVWIEIRETWYYLSICSTYLRALQEHCIDTGVLELSELTSNSLRGSFYPNSYAYIESYIEYVSPCFVLPSVCLTPAAFFPCHSKWDGLVYTVLVCWLRYNTVPASSVCKKCLNVKGG